MFTPTPNPAQPRRNTQQSDSPGIRSVASSRIALSCVVSKGKYNDWKAGFVTAQRAKAMAEAKHPKNWKELGQSNPMRDIFVEKLVQPLHL
jgi:hypothetical protein